MKVGESYDVIIVGSGGAGLCSAISAAENGLKVLIMSKGRVNRSGATQLAGSGLGGDIEADGESLWNLGYKDADRTHTRETWFKNLILQGSFLNDQGLTENYVNTSGEIIKNMLDWGMKPYFLLEGVALFVAGTHILDILYRRARELGAEAIGNRIVTDIVTYKNHVAGVVSIDVYTGEMFYNSAKAVIIATGGCQGLYSLNSGTAELTCDGISMALRAGAEIQDMEMIEFCNDTIVHPRKYKGNILPYVLRLFGYGELLNKDGECFLERYFSSDIIDIALHTEWNKELVSYAEYMEIKKGKGVNGGVIFTMENSPESEFKSIYGMFPMINHAPMDVEIMKRLENGERLYVAPASHYIPGGIRVNSNYETNINGLYAAGECKAGTFGANRVSSALTEMLVEGYLAGKKAGQYAKGRELLEVPRDYLEKYEEEVLKPFGTSHESKFKSFVELRKKLQETMWEYVGPVKNEKDLLLASNIVDELSKELLKIKIKDSSREYNPEWIEYLNLRNMILASKAIVKSSLIRKESRGVHIREDYFFVDNKNWLKHIVIYDTSLNYRFENVIITKLQPKPVKMPYLDYIRTLLKEVKGAY